MKKYSLKFWLIFWLSSALFLTGWFFYWEAKNQGLGKATSAVLNWLPLDKSKKKEYAALGTFLDAFMKKDDQEKTFLILFQNNMEIRPGGGFIGSFGILKLKNGQIEKLETHDLSNFDARIPDTVAVPYPMKETLHIAAWKLRDSNYAPDFAENAKKAEEFYYMGKGEEKFDGVIGITTNVLTSMLKVTGPISIEGYPGTYDNENAILALEYQVEKGFADQGIERGERKSVMNDLAKEISKRIMNASTKEKIALADIVIEDLKRKDIQLYFADEKLENAAKEALWDGTMNADWDKDYLMTVDANLGAYKSDYYVKRSLDYAIDLTKEKAEVKLKIAYEHTAKQKDWMTKDYLTYLRVYVPKDAWLVSQKNFDGTKFGNEFGKKFFGAIVKVPLGTSKTVELNYLLPQFNAGENYDLLVQKQAGLNNVPVHVKVILPNGEIKEFSKTLDSDLKLSEIVQ